MFLYNSDIVILTINFFEGNMKHSLKITAHSAKVGADLVVLRGLPNAQFESIGPFVFLDHFGPMPHFTGGPGAHPHAGIEVITWLFEGANEHRDSLGNQCAVTSGGAQWLKSGRGALHAETFLSSAPITHGLQLWTRMSLTTQEDAPDYRGFQAAQIPDWSDEHAQYRLLIGQMGAQTGPLVLSIEGLALRVTLKAGAHVKIPVKGAHQLGMYGLSGAVRTEGQEISRADLMRFADGTTQIELRNEAQEPADVVIFGGLPAPQPLVFHGPFVFESRERIEQAMHDYSNGSMGQLEGVPF
jgi:redox-sensitive bicupin YhaK (pirin superfamily)